MHMYIYIYIYRMTKDHQMTTKKLLFSIFTLEPYPTCLGWFLFRTVVCHPLRLNPILRPPLHLKFPHSHIFVLALGEGKWVLVLHFVLLKQLYI